MAEPATGGVRRQRQLQTRERLLDAARSVFALRGYEAATIPEIAHEAAVSTGAIYSNFAGKQDLFLTMVGRAVTEGATRRAEAAAAQLPPDGLLRAAVRDWTDRVDDDPQLLMLVAEFWLYALRHDELRAALPAFFTAVRSNLAETIRAGASDLPDADLDRLARVIQALAYGYAFQRLADPDATDPDDLRWGAERLLREAGEGRRADPTAPTGSTGPRRPDVSR